MLEISHMIKIIVMLTILKISVTVTIQYKITSILAFKRLCYSLSADAVILESLSMDNKLSGELLTFRHRASCI